MGAWLNRVTPTYRWDWPHIVMVREALEAVTRGEIQRLIVTMPPRHGKSELVTVRYPVYRLECDPTQRVIIGAYNQGLALKFSRKARKIARERFALSGERNAAEDWETVKGGGVRAVGVGGGVTGQGGNLVIIDDPVKNREEAESETYRERVWDWFTNDIYTRLEPNAALVLMMTRWNRDDLVGRVLASEQGPSYKVINLPAEAEAGDPLGRAEGEALCSDRYPLTELKKIRSVLGRDYYALYQQRPQPREGGMFKEHWLKLVDEVPKQARRIRWWDKAATQDGGNHTAGVLMAEADGIYYVEDVKRGQWSSGERDRIIRATAETDRGLYGQVTYWGPQDPGAAGKDAAAAFIRLLAGFDVHTQIETGSKEVRAQPLAAQAEAGNFRVKRADWTAHYVAEMCDFPSGKFDDQVDASSGSFNKLGSNQVTSVENPFYN